MKKRNLWKWFSGMVVTAGLTVFLAVPPQVAGPVGTAINDRAWEYFEDGDEKGSAEEQQAAEKRLLLDEGRDDRQGQAEETDGSVQLREEDGSEGRTDRLKEAATSVLIDEVTRSLDKSR